MRSYMAEKGLQELFEGILVSLIQNKPDDPVGYTIDYLKDNRFQAELGRIAKVREEQPGNRCTKHFDEGYFKSLAPELQERLIEIARSGFENPDSGVGAYAMNPDDYDTFKPFLGKVIADYHGVAEDAVHVNNWSLEGVEGIPEDGKLDLTALGLGELSMRVRVGRNLADFPLPGAMTADDRKALENKMTESVFSKLIADEAYGGEYNSLTPGHANFIDEARYKELVDAHIMFKDMDADPYLKSAGISSDWPIGRGCYVSADKGFIIWVGEEDHLRIMCMKKGSLLNEVFDRLEQVLKMIDGFEGLSFGKSPWAGYVTSCPSNLGSGMRASVHIPLPNLTKNGSDVSEAKTIAKGLGLSVRGAGGEHTAAGEGGIVDISPSARFFITEAQIITALYKGIQQLYEAETKASAEGA